MHKLADLKSSDRYRLANCTVPALLVQGDGRAGLVQADIDIANGKILAIGAPESSPVELPAVDMARSMVLPGFVDMHTHIDKGHIWPRSPNPDGTFMGALLAVKADRESSWSDEDVRRRMDFALRCAYAHGTVALRTHLDSIPPQDEITWPLFAEMRRQWKGRVDLQAVALMGIDQMLDAGILRQVARCAKTHGGILGGAMASHPLMGEAIGRALDMATELGLDIDLHLDETQDAASNGLRLLAETVLARKFRGKVVAGHCCSLARQDDDEAKRTIELVAEAGIDVVSLPMCNLYLQDRGDGSTTPRYRGVTLIRELLAAGVNVSVASDNARDPFYAYGDLDCLEVLRETVRIGHLDHPIDIAPALVTRSPAQTMGIDAGVLAPGQAADLVILRGRDWSEVLSRPESGRIVIRNGKVLDAELPDYRELDDLMER
ncbi:MAG: cytosine deaminase [Rhizobiaceae bacterium]